MTRRAWERPALVVLLAVIALLLVWGVSCAPRVAGPGGVRADSSGTALLVDFEDGEQSLALDGRLDRTLSPGRSSAVDVQIDNRHDRPLQLAEVVVSLRSVQVGDGGRCETADFEVVQGDLEGMTVPAGARTSLSRAEVPRERWPRLRMVDRDHSQDACKGATLVLDYDARGRGA